MELETEVYYLTECEACKHRMKYIVRAENTNIGISDDDVIGIADRNLGSYSSVVCEGCGLFSRHKVIGYRWKVQDGKL